jgi:hypothetical protein
MNCIEAQKYFADLLDHSRDERLRKVNDHLAACGRCRQELAALAECQGLVSALPPMEPPAGFTTRVMAEVRNAAHRPGIWQRLFLGMQKLPLQAAAVILISVLAVFIYQRESGLRESATTVPPPSPVQKQAEADKSQPTDVRGRTLEAKAKNPAESEAQGSTVKRLTKTEKPRSADGAEERSNTIGEIEPGAGKAPPLRASGTPASVAPSQPKEESSPAGQPRAVRQEQSLRSGGAQAKDGLPSAPLRDNDTTAGERTSGGESLSSDGLEEKRARSSFDALGSSTARFSDRKLILRLKQPARDDRSTESLAELDRPQTGASRTRLKDLEHGQRRAIQTGKPQTVSAIIDASQYDELREDLARLGKIESEAPAAANQIDALSKSSGQLRLTITILPPNSSTQPPSTR